MIKRYVKSQPTEVVYYCSFAQLAASVQSQLGNWNSRRAESVAVWPAGQRQFSLCCTVASAPTVGLPHDQKHTFSVFSTQ